MPNTTTKSQLTRQGSAFVGTEVLKGSYVDHILMILQEMTRTYGGGDGKTEEFHRFCEHLTSAIINDDDRKTVEAEIKKKRDELTVKMEAGKEGLTKRDIEFTCGFLVVQKTYAYLHKTIGLSGEDTTGVVSNILEIDLEDFKRDMDARAGEGVE